MSIEEQYQFAGKSYKNYLYIKRTYYPDEKVMSASQYHKMWR